MIDFIILDPGHGGEDNGAVWGYTEEDDTNLSICYLLRCELEKENFQVEMTRERDEAISLKKRVDMANEMRPGLFLSIHCDAFHNITAKGISTHIQMKPSNDEIEIAGYIHNSLTLEFSDHSNRGLRNSDFYVLRKTIMPAVLVECEFISNPDARKFLKEPENQLRIARAITGAIK